MNEPVTYENLGKSIPWMKKLLFAGVFIQENKLHAVFDRYSDMSSKQWLLMAVCKSFDEAPDLTTLANAMGCSRQNIKKLAANLEKSGYVRLEKTLEDARALHVVITDKGKAYNEKNTELGEFVHREIFKEFTDEDIRKYYELSVKMMHGIEHLERGFQARI